MARTHADEAFADFVRLASPSLMRTAWLLTGDRDSAADLVQAALLKALQARRRIPEQDALAYTRRILINENIDRWRRRHGEVATGAAFDVPSPDSLADRVADRDRVARMLATLTPTQRRVVVMRYYEDLTEAQTAEALGMTVGAVKAASHRALAALRSHYPDAAGPARTPTDTQGGAQR